MPVSYTHLDVYKRQDTEWLEITRHTSLDNSRTDSSAQTLRIEKNDKAFAFFMPTVYSIRD